jgi:hypothetical protein
MKTPKILKPRIDGAGYAFVTLYKNSIGKMLKIHKLVAINFMGHIPNGLDRVIDHIDNNKLNNKLDNLQEISHRENSSKDKKFYSSKHTGVRWDKQKNKWGAMIRIDKKPTHLGYYGKEIDAANAYQDVLKSLDTLDFKKTLEKYRPKTKSKYTGVTFDEHAKKWLSVITISGERHYLGLHEDEDEAGVVYMEYHKKHGKRKKTYIREQ